MIEAHTTREYREMFHENAIISIDGYWLHIMQSNAVKHCVEQLLSFIYASMEINLPFFNYRQTNFNDDAKFSTILRRFLWLFLRFYGNAFNRGEKILQPRIDLIFLMT